MVCHSFLYVYQRVLEISGNQSQQPAAYGGSKNGATPLDGLFRGSARLGNPSGKDGWKIPYLVGGFKHGFYLPFHGHRNSGFTHHKREYIMG